MASVHMEAGTLLPTPAIAEMIQNRLSERDATENGWLLDGFPRTVDQAIMTSLTSFFFDMHTYPIRYFPPDDSLLLTSLSPRKRGGGPLMCQEDTPDTLSFRLV